MKKKTTLYITALALLAAFQLTTTDVYTNDDKAPAGKTGAPSEMTCAKSECHTDHPLNSGPGSVSLLFNGGASYQPSTDYVITITVAQTGVLKHGFELTALRDDTYAFTGTYANPPIDPRTMQWNVGAVQARKYMTHKEADSVSGVFSVGWKSPATDVGCITFYAAGNNADGNNNDTIGSSGFPGDFIYTTTLQICPAINFGVYEVGNNSQGTFVYGNPLQDLLHLKYVTDETDALNISLYDINGQLKQLLLNEEEIPGLHEHTFSIADFPRGIYFVRLQSGSSSRTEKIVVQ